MAGVSILLDRTGVIQVIFPIVEFKYLYLWYKMLRPKPNNGQ